MRSHPPGPPSEFTAAGAPAVERLAGELARVGVGRVLTHEPLARHARWRVGGPADILVEPGSPDELGRLLRWTHEHHHPVLVIGDGANLLFADAGVRGIVLKIGGRLGRLAIISRRVRAGAGIWVPRLAHRVGAAGLSGIEHTVGIPGTLGGLVVMNGGSQRKGIGSHVVSVRCFDQAGNALELGAKACAFAYRRSSLQDAGLVVSEVDLVLEPGEPRHIRREMIAIMASRRRRFPLKLPNCGSVFLSDPAMYAVVGPPGQVIEAAGLKGLRRGGAEVAQAHANFIVNRGGATAADILWLINEVRKTVQARTNYWLDCEVRYVFPDGRVRPAHEAAENPALHGETPR